MARTPPGSKGNLRAGRQEDRTAVRRISQGEDSLWGRFSDYARTGHGGNAELRHRAGAQYQIAVLQVVDMSLPDHSIEEIEGWWKRKLMSREHGLNRN